MEQITRVVERGEAVRVGVDLAKRVIQVHAVDAAGHVLTSRALVRDKFLAWCMQLPAGCIVAMETHLGPHTRKLGACNKAVSGEPVGSFVHALRCRLLIHQPQICIEVFDDECEFSL